MANLKIEALRTPDDRFAALPGYGYAPHYIEGLAGSGSLRVHYVDEAPAGAASGRTVLCLHGQPTWAYLHRKMIPVFAAAGHRVVAPDLLGFGRSDKPVDDSVYTFLFHRGMLLRFVEALDLRRITLVVQDWGGLLGLTLPMEYPDRIDRLVVMNTGLGIGRSPGPGFDAWKAFVASRPDFDIALLMKRSVAEVDGRGGGGVRGAVPGCPLPRGRAPLPGARPGGPRHGGRRSLPACRGIAERSHLVRGLVYPVPDPSLPFLGVHLTRKVDGSVLLGPNAVLAYALEGYRRRDVNVSDLRETASWPGMWRVARQHWATGIHEVLRSTSRRAFVHEARRYVPALRAGDVVPAPAGVRAQAIDRDGTLVDDFRLDVSRHVVWVRNAPSPAATSTLAIAEELVSAPRAVGPSGHPHRGPSCSGH